MTLHIVSFDIPFPPNYGGVIDVFYTIKALHHIGIDIILHCFQYHRSPAEELEKYCSKVYYYRRKTGLIANLSVLPYIVFSRKNDLLLQRLLKDSYPILFEGLHSCYYVDDKRLQNRLLIYRESNIEHHYYFHLFRLQRNLIKRFYFLSEAVRLYFFQSKLQHVNLVLVVSSSDKIYLRHALPTIRTELLSSFHANDTVNCLPGQGTYALYHGNLAIGENENAARFLVEQVFGALPFRLVIAGQSPSARLRKIVGRYSNVELMASPDEPTMHSLISEAHVNLMVTFQSTGLKLKLLNALFNGRFCLANETMLHGTGLEELCVIANSANEIRQRVESLFSKKFTATDVLQRRILFPECYSNKKNAELLVQYLQQTNIEKTDDNMYPNQN